MSQPDARDMLVAAEQAAAAGDLGSADQWLRDAARVQEAELGPLHPDLASTLNNLAIVAEKTGRQGDAETFYRRAAAIASASLPPDHPMVAETRQNLEDFCRASGVPIEAPPAAQAESPPAAQIEAPPTAPIAAARPAPSPESNRDAKPDVAAREDPGETTGTLVHDPAAAQPAASAPRTASHALTWTAIGVAILLAAGLFATRPWAPRQAPRAPGGPPPAAAPIEQPTPPTALPRGDTRGAATDTRRSSAPSAGVSLASVELCQTFSTSGGEWRCKRAGDAVAPGPIVLYTRVRSPRDGSVLHRWYRGETLQQSVRLSVRANATAGYRTYSRQTVNAGEEWRVEVRSPAGDLLYEQRFAVR